MPEKSEICYRVLIGLLFGRLSAWSNYLIYDYLIVNSNSFPSPSKPVKIALLSIHVYTGGPSPAWLLWLTSREVTQWAHPSILCNFTFFLPSSCYWIISQLQQWQFQATSFCGVKNTGRKQHAPQELVQGPPRTNPYSALEKCSREPIELAK